jgi:hypothetical protein
MDESAGNENFGLNSILKSITDLSRTDYKNKRNLFLVNIETMVRNRKMTSIAETAENVKQDCNLLVQYISNYTGKSQEKGIVCFYMNSYNAIPQLYRKDKLPKGTEERWAVAQQLFQLLSSGYGTAENLDVLYMFGEGKTNLWPHKELLKELSNKYSGLSFKKTLMISHVPIDFHVHKYVGTFVILESFTGTFKTVKQLGKKVFSSEYVPFNKYTHLLLGDKWYLKSLVDHATKKKILKQAEEKNWAVLPDKYVLKELVDMHLKEIDSIIQPNI